MLKHTLLLIFSTLLVTACSKTATGPLPTVTPEVQTALATFPTLAPQTPAPSTSPTPFASFSASPTVDNLNIRINPGYLFDAWGVVQQTDTLTVLGKAPGDEWIYVETAAGVKGWAFAELLKSEVDLKQVPVQTPTEVVVISGQVLDVNGTPIQGIGFDIKQGSEEGAPTNVVLTDAKGEFYSFLPADATGVWSVSQTAIACNSNIWLDGACTTYKSGYTGTVEPQTISVTLPQASPLKFTWK